MDNDEVDYFRKEVEKKEKKSINKGEEWLCYYGRELKEVGFNLSERGRLFWGIGY